MTVETFEQEFSELDIPNGNPQWIHCNHCVNNWGIDLCNCGSGEPVGDCDNGLEDCINKIPAQIKGEMKSTCGWG